MKTPKDSGIGTEAPGSGLTEFTELEVHNLLEIIRESCSPATWSKGVRTTRDQTVSVDSKGADEIVLRITGDGIKISPKITLWPRGEDFRCDCASDEDPCFHIAACVIALYQAIKKGTALAQSQSSLPKLAYRFSRRCEGLVFERYIVKDGISQNLKFPLKSIVAGRMGHQNLAISKEDLTLETIIEGRPSWLIDNPKICRNLLEVLTKFEEAMTLDGKEVGIDPTPVGICARICDEGPGVFLRGSKDPSIGEIWHETIALCQGSLHPVAKPELNPNEIRMLTEGQYFGPREFPHLVAEIIPPLAKKISVDIETNRLPKLAYERPRVVIDTAIRGEDNLMVTCKIVYGNPIKAEVRNDRLVAFANEIPCRDLDAERSLRDNLWHEAGLELNSPTLYERNEALKLVEKFKNQKRDISDEVVSKFTLYPNLHPRLEASLDNFKLEFWAKGRDPSGKGEERFADPLKVIEAWENNDSIVGLNDYGFAPLPKQWLNQYGAKIRELLEARANSQKLPKSALFELCSLCDDLGTPPPAALDTIRKNLMNFDQTLEFKLPTDMEVKLREYQLIGINWLFRLKKIGVGAILADDMGLGKTLQSLAIITGKTLIVAPLSVILNWKKELKRFRPLLKFNVYHGPNRALDTGVEVTLTTYSTLRIDLECFSGIRWDMIILDESQHIKNAGSQIARACHLLTGDFKLALTGTPVENNLLDLWSQFNFINPGLLGSQKFFQKQYLGPINGGKEKVKTRLKEKIKPFIMRRLKTEVAKWLPPKTQMPLYVSLDATERHTYEAIKLAASKEVLSKLNENGNVFAALEALLRLRQVCCHLGLLPNQSSESSSKITLLQETLVEIVAENHKALVFSQWTSFLDLLEPALKAINIEFLRLDGATKDREAVVESFQAEGGAPVLLMSLKAGGVGLNLTAADHIFIMDPWWNPAVEDQAADRAHRIGQKNPVFIHRIIALDTIEEMMYELQNSKRNLSQSVVGDANNSHYALTKEDIIKLLE